MKRFINLLSVAFAFAFMVSCSSSPSSIASDYMDAMCNKDYTKLTDAMYFKGSAEEAAKTKAGYIEMLESMNSSLSDKQIVTSYNILEEIVDESGKKATVKVSTTLKSGKTDDMELLLISVDGKWLVNSGK